MTISRDPLDRAGFLDLSAAEVADMSQQVSQDEATQAKAMQAVHDRHRQAKDLADLRHQCRHRGYELAAHVLRGLPLADVRDGISGVAHMIESDLVASGMAVIEASRPVSREDIRNALMRGS